MKYIDISEFIGNKLTVDIVKHIRSSKENVKELSKKYNIDESTIYRVRRFSSWKII